MGTDTDVAAALRQLLDAFQDRDYEAALKAAEALLDQLARAGEMPDPTTLRFSPQGSATPRS